MSWPSAYCSACFLAVSSSLDQNSMRSSMWPSGPMTYARYSRIAPSAKPLTDARRINWSLWRLQSRRPFKWSSKENADPNPADLRREPMSLPGRWRWCDRPWLCDAQKKQARFTHWSASVILRPHAEGMPLPRREPWTRRGCVWRVLTAGPELENSQGHSLPRQPILLLVRCRLCLNSGPARAQRWRERTGTKKASPKRGLLVCGADQAAVSSRLSVSCGAWWSSKARRERLPECSVMNFE